VGEAVDGAVETAGQPPHLPAHVRSLTALVLVERGAGVLICTVRLLVRDAIAMCVSRLIVYAAEEAASFGIATPLVVEQVTTTVAARAARISRVSR
jgi:hypothetical protein